MKTTCRTTHPKRDVQWRYRHWNHDRSKEIQSNASSVSSPISLLLPLLSMRMIMIRALLSI